MSNHSSLDRESFQQLLASAFAVQESQIDSESLCAIVEVQRLVARTELDIDGALHRIAESARNVANATGVAIGLLKGDQLIYRAGSGCAAAYAGHQVTASLTVSAGTQPSNEILRVENAQTDTRIEAAICRQFEAKSLLILPIYHDRALAGVLEVLFSEAHAFQDCEVRTYRLMAGVIEEAMLQATRVERKKNLGELPTTPHAVGRITPQRENSSNDFGVLRQPALLASLMVQRAKEGAWYKRRQNVALAALAVVLVLTGWIVYSRRGSASPLGSSALPRSAAVEPQTGFLPTKAMPAKGASVGKLAPVPVKKARPGRTAARRVRVSENEVDYIRGDVTVRYFTYKPAPQRRRVGESRVAHIGEDVTVRYFTQEPAARPASR